MEATNVNLEQTGWGKADEVTLHYTNQIQWTQKHNYANQTQLLMEPRWNLLSAPNKMIARASLRMVQG